MMEDEISKFESFSMENNDIYFKRSGGKSLSSRTENDPNPIEIVQDRNNPKFRVVQKLVFENPDLVDTFLADRDPRYKTYDIAKKKNLRNILPYLKPYDIYERYMKWLDEQE